MSITLNTHLSNNISFNPNPTFFDRAREITKTASPLIAAAGMVAIAIVFGASTLGFGYLALLGGAGLLLLLSVIMQYLKNRRQTEVTAFYINQLQKLNQESQSQLNTVRNVLHKETSLKSTALATSTTNPANRIHSSVLLEQLNQQKPTLEAQRVEQARQTKLEQARDLAKIQQRASALNEHN